MNSKIEIEDDDILEANERMSGKDVEKKRTSPSDLAFAILSVLFIIGIAIYLQEWTKKKNGKLSYKDEEGNMQEIDTEISMEEINSALDKLKKPIEDEKI